MTRVVEHRKLCLKLYKDSLDSQNYFNLIYIRFSYIFMKWNL